MLQSFAKRALVKIEELNELESNSASKNDVSTVPVFRSATIRVGSVIFLKQIYDYKKRQRLMPNRPNKNKSLKDIANVSSLINCSKCRISLNRSCPNRSRILLEYFILEARPKWKPQIENESAIVQALQKELKLFFIVFFHSIQDKKKVTSIHISHQI